jgi:Ca2+:H+ antiporter
LAAHLSLALWAEHFRPDAHVFIFAAACLAIIPLAAILGRATECIAARAGDALGGFLNATFGNAAELIIAIVALRAGQVDVVKASLTGSIIGNILLVLGVLSSPVGCATTSRNSTPLAPARRPPR